MLKKIIKTFIPRKENQLKDRNQTNTNIICVNANLIRNQEPNVSEAAD